MVDDAGAAIGQNFHRVLRVPRNNSHDARTHDFRHAFSCDFEFTFHHFVDFFLRMKVFVDCRAFHKIVMPKVMFVE